MRVLPRSSWHWNVESGRKTSNANASPAGSKPPQKRRLEVARPATPEAGASAAACASEASAHPHANSATPDCGQTPPKEPRKIQKCWTVLGLDRSISRSEGTTPGSLPSSRQVIPLSIDLYTPSVNVAATRRSEFVASRHCGVPSYRVSSSPLHSTVSFCLQVRPPSDDAHSPVRSAYRYPVIATIRSAFRGFTESARVCTFARLVGDIVPSIRPKILPPLSDRYKPQMSVTTYSRFVSDGAGCTCVKYPRPRSRSNSTARRSDVPRPLRRSPPNTPPQPQPPHPSTPSFS